MFVMWYRCSQQSWQQRRCKLQLHICILNLCVSLIFHVVRPQRNEVPEYIVHMQVSEWGCLGCMVFNIYHLTVSQYKLEPLYGCMDSPPHYIHLWNHCIHLRMDNIQGHISTSLDFFISVWIGFNCEKKRRRIKYQTTRDLGIRRRQNCDVLHGTCVLEWS